MLCLVSNSLCIRISFHLPFQKFYNPFAVQNHCQYPEVTCSIHHQSCLPSLLTIFLWYKYFYLPWCSRRIPLLPQSSVSFFHHLLPTFFTSLSGCLTASRTLGWSCWATFCSTHNFTFCCTIWHILVRNFSLHMAHWNIKVQTHFNCTYKESELCVRDSQCLYAIIANSEWRTISCHFKVRDY